MKITIIAQSKEYLEKIGIEKTIANVLAEYFRTIQDKKLKKHLIKQIKNNITTLNANKSKVINSPEYIQKLYPLVERDEIDVLMKNFNVSENAARHAFGLNREYAFWIAKMIDAKSIIPVEDDDKVIDLLSDFNKLKNSTTFPTVFKDIMKYKQYGDLAAVVEEYIGSKSQRQIEKEIISSSVSTRYEANGVKCLEISSPEAMTNYASSHWCVKDITWARKYITEYGGNYFLFYINDSKVALVHKNSNQIKDFYDRPLDNAIIISRIDPVIEKLKLNSKKGDFINYQNTKNKTKETNDFIRKGPVEKRKFANDLKSKPKYYYLLDEENRKDKSLFEAAKYGFISNDDGSKVDQIPEEFVKYIPQEQWNEWLEEYSDHTATKTVHYHGNNGPTYAFTDIPVRIRARYGEEFLQIVTNNYEKDILDNPYLYSDVPPDIRVRLSPEITTFVKDFWVKEFKEKTLSSIFVDNYRDMPEYFKWNTKFIEEVVPILKRRIQDSIAKFVILPIQFQLAMEKMFPEEMSNFHETIRDQFETFYNNVQYDSDNEHEPNPDDNLSEELGLETEQIKAYIGRDDVGLEDDRMKAWYKYIEAHPKSYDDIAAEDTNGDYELYQARDTGWSNLIDDDPWKFNELPDDLDHLFSDDDDEEPLQRLGPMFINYFMKHKDESDKLNHLPEIAGDNQDNLITYIVSHLSEKLTDQEFEPFGETFYYMAVDKDETIPDLEEIAGNTLKEKIQSILVEKWKPILSEESDFYSQSIYNAAKTHQTNIILKKHLEVLNSLFHFSEQDPYGINEILINLPKEPQAYQLVTNFLASYMQALNNPDEEFIKNELNKIYENLQKKQRSVYVYNNQTNSYVTIELKDVKQLIDQNQLKEAGLKLTQFITELLKSQGNYGYADISKPNFSIDVPEHIQKNEALQSYQLSPWYNLIMTNSKLLKDPSSEYRRQFVPWVKKFAPKEVLNMFEIKNIIDEIPPDTLEAWYKIYLKKIS